MTFTFDRGQLQKYLEIATNLYEKVPLQHITRDLHTSGRTVGMIKKLIDGGYVKYNPDTHKAEFTAPIEEVEAYLDELHYQKYGKRMKAPITTSAAEAVETVLKTETAKEATERTAQYMQIGRTVAKAYWQWAEKHGIPIEQAVKQDIGRIVSETLDYHTRGKQLERRVMQLEDALRACAREVDPILRLKTASILVYKFLEFAALAELAGFNIENSPLVNHYQKMIEFYLKGGFEPA